MSHHLTDAHIESLAVEAAEASLARGGIELEARRIQARKNRIEAAMAARGLRLTNSRKSVLSGDRVVAQVVGSVRISSAAATALVAVPEAGLIGRQAVALARALQRCRLAAGRNDDRKYWNNLARNPVVLTDFTDRSSATRFHFGF